MSRILPVLVALLAAAPVFAGCLAPDALPVVPLSAIAREIAWDGTLTFSEPAAYDGKGSPVSLPSAIAGEALPWGIQQLLPEGGAEPNIGITSTGAIFVTSDESVFRSRDHGVTWEKVHDFVTPGHPTTVDAWSSGDPMLWVDTLTDRVYVNHMHPSLTCTFMAWSDDEGATWFERPFACTTPGTDHQKVMTAPSGPQAKVHPVSEIYPNVLYICHNKVDFVGLVALGTTCMVSLDGGYTYPYEREAYISDPFCGNVNGHPAAFPDGTVAMVLGRLGPRACMRELTVLITEDNGLTWDVRKCNPELGQVEIDADMTVTPDGTAYVLYRDRDQMAHLLRSTDKFRTCDHFRVAPPDHTMSVFAGITSGDDGRIAMAYLGTRDPVKPGATPTNVTLGTRWHLFVTTSFDAASENPTFVTQQITPHEDPVQIGCIWLQGGAGGPHECRNLLDFIDMTVDPDGRYVVAITDGCTPKSGCTGQPDEKESDFQSHDRQIAVAVQDRGMSLYAEKGILPSLGLQPPVALER